MSLTAVSDGLTGGPRAVHAAERQSEIAGRSPAKSATTAQPERSRRESTKMALRNYTFNIGKMARPI